MISSPQTHYPARTAPNTTRTAPTDVETAANGDLWVDTIARRARELAQWVANKRATRQMDTRRCQVAPGSTILVIPRLSGERIAAPPVSEPQSALGGQSGHEVGAHNAPPEDSVAPPQYIRFMAPTSRRRACPALFSPDYKRAIVPSRHARAAQEARPVPYEVVGMESQAFAALAAPLPAAFGAARQCDHRHLSTAAMSQRGFRSVPLDRIRDASTLR